MASAATDVLAKVGVVLPPELSYKLEDSSLIVGSGFVRPLSVELAQLRRAIREECKISIRYRDRFSAADIYVGSHIGWGMEFGTMDKRPEFVEYWDGLKNRPAHLHTEQLIEKALTKHAWSGM